MHNDMLLKSATQRKLHKVMLFVTKKF